jgi:hypothetical protein
MDFDSNILDQQDETAIIKRKGKQFGVIGLILSIGSVLIFLGSILLAGITGSNYMMLIPYPIIITAFICGIYGKSLTKPIKAGNGAALATIIISPIVLFYGSVMIFAAVEELNSYGNNDSILYDDAYYEDDAFNWEDY